MGDLTATTVAANYLKNTRANGLGPRTVIVTVAKTGGVTNANLNTIINYLTTSHGSGTPSTGDSAFVVAGLSGSTTGGAFTSGSTETVYLALQGTGDLTVADADCGISGYTVAIIATFDQNYQ
jgi:hypothetical protein